jgi:hypothetical protein
MYIHAYIYVQSQMVFMGSSGLSCHVYISIAPPCHVSIRLIPFKPPSLTHLTLPVLPRITLIGVR